MEVIRAKNLGFCAGVKKAMETVENAFMLSKARNLPCYIYGDIVHNRFVMEQFEASGIKKIMSPEENVPVGVLIIRTHGIADDIKASFVSKGFIVVDATCPEVLKNQKRIRETDKHPLIIGYEGHSEVDSLLGAAREKCLVINAVEDVDELDPSLSYGAIVQTTFSSQRLEKIIARIKELNLDVELMNAICNASKLRRNGVRELQGKVDAILVVGDRHSTNTNELVTVANECGTKGILVENVDGISTEITAYNKIGLTAGASTPKNIYDEVEDFLRCIDGRN